MPSEVGLAPWFVVLFWVVRIGLPLGVLVMQIDILRRPDTHFGRGPLSSRWSWVTQNMLLLLVLLVSLLGIVTGPALQVAALAFVPLTFVQGLRYLLTVVFPSPKRLEARRAAEEREGGAGR